MGRLDSTPDNHRSRRQRGAVLSALPLVAAVMFGLAFIGVMLGMMTWWGGSHTAMMGRGSAGTDQTPVVADASRVTVEMKNFEFFPADLTVAAGTEVTWVNRDSLPHNAVAEDGTFDTVNQGGGESASVVLDQPGIYPYVCTFHPGMQGTITVR